MLCAQVFESGHSAAMHCEAEVTGYPENVCNLVVINAYPVHCIQVEGGAVQDELCQGQVQFMKARWSQ